MIIKMQCPKCGSEMTMETEKGFSFCNNCGEKVSFGGDNSSQPQVQVQYQQPMQIQNNTAIYHQRVAEFVSSPIAFAMAISQAVLLCLIYTIGFYYDIFWVMLILSIPAIAATVESWVTYGTAKWGKTGAKTAGLTVGKVFSVIHIVLSGITVFASFIAMVAWSVISSWAGDYVQGVLEFIFGTDFGAKNMQSFVTNLGMIVFFVTLLPIVFWIILQVMLNKFRDNVRAGINCELNQKAKTIFPAVLLFLFAIICTVLGIIFFYAKASLFGITVILHACILFFGGVMLIMFENRINGKK